MKSYGWALHFHHDDCLIEALIEPIGVRQEEIREHKPESEQGLRLRLLRRLTAAEVRRIPASLREAGRAYQEAGRASDEAGRASDEARRAYQEARRASDEAGRACQEAGRAVAPALDALHAAICLPDCPWDGQSIFGGVR